MPPRPASSFRVDLPRFAGSVVGLPIVDRIGELCRSRDQFLLRPTELQRILGDAAHQDVEELWVDSAFEGSGGESVRLVR